MFSFQIPSFQLFMLSVGNIFLLFIRYDFFRTTGNSNMLCFSSLLVPELRQPLTLLSCSSSEICSIPFSFSALCFPVLVPALHNGWCVRISKVRFPFHLELRPFQFSHPWIQQRTWFPPFFSPSPLSPKLFWSFFPYTILSTLSSSRVQQILAFESAFFRDCRYFQTQFVPWYSIFHLFFRRNIFLTIFLFSFSSCSASRGFLVFTSRTNTEPRSSPLPYKVWSSHSLTRSLCTLLLSRSRPSSTSPSPSLIPRCSFFLLYIRSGNWTCSPFAWYRLMLPIVLVIFSVFYV